MAPFDQFLDFLAEPDLSKWALRARSIVTSWFLQGMKDQSNRAAIMTLVGELAGPEARVTLADTERDTLCTQLGAASSSVIAVAASKSWRPPAWPELDDLTAVVGVEHRLSKSSEAKWAWSGTLRLMNLLQFLPYFYVGCSQSIAPEAALRPTEAPGVDLWSDITDVVLSDLLRWFRSSADARHRCRRRSTRPPAPTARSSAPLRSPGLTSVSESSWMRPSPHRSLAGLFTSSTVTVG